MGAVAHAQRPFRAASFLRRRLAVGAVAHAPRPSLGAVPLPTFKQMLLNASIITFDTIVASMMGKEEIGGTKITVSESETLQKHTTPAMSVIKT